MGDMRQDEQLADQARNNTPEQFKLAFDPKAMAALITRLERNENISGQLLSNEELRAAAMAMMMQNVYEYFQSNMKPST